MIEEPLNTRDRSTPPGAARPGTETAPNRGLRQIHAAPMPALTDEWERRVYDDPNLLGDIAFAVGGPFHLMYPQRVGRNIERFHAAFEQAGVDGVVYYGKKANKAACVGRVCAQQGAGVDVSSIGELTSALAQGVRGHELMVTGPAKSDDLLWLAVRRGALIAVDSLDELDRLATLTTVAAPAEVVLRVLPAISTSRFGMTGGELGRALSLIGSSGTVGNESIRLTGFSFHLSGYDAVARAEQAHALIDRCRDARTLGHPVTTISIGGGFGVDYVPASAWAEFTAAADPRWFHAGKSFGSYYPYHFPAPGPAMLTTILDHHGLAGRLRDNGIRLAVEPGRALLDHAGCTVFRVQGSKTRHTDGQPYHLLTVDGSSLSLSEQWFDSEYLPDPMLWPQQPGGTPTPTCVGAATCLESDMLSWRRIPLPRPATIGDLLIYPNTAGYQMDSNESAFHELPIPPKAVLHEAPGERLRWTLDAG
ncbi:Y4yA family PLP-dependent enzyme [Nocardia sp. NBC_00403]|uniref:Y4yA family PLP-dependent enzyme n=1 Tax=Nocardia sp. NBC_00403 TaxID=2975990 RepID=UPI002E2283E0